jgi:hypothetical protein
VRIIAVEYGSSSRKGDHHTVMLRDAHHTPDEKWIRGIPCNVLGVADRDGCNDAELVIRADRILAIREVV